MSCIVFYDRKKKIIVKSGACRPNGCGSSKISSHAEELAIKYCRQFDNKNKYDIYIWRYGRTGDIKTASCCKACTKLATKYNYQHRIFTFNEGNIVSAVVDNPVVSLGNMLRNL